jgi:hypothetical protein
MQSLIATSSPPTLANHMSLKVDLTLAVNYLPACACLGKMLVFMLAVGNIPVGREIDAFVLLAALLYMDRLVTRNIIFDANAILLAVFFANVHAGIRALTIHRAYQALMDGMYFFWATGSVVLICEPPVVKQALERRARLSRIVPVILMLLIVVSTSHFHEPLEPAGWRSCRAVAFTLLSFAWIYIIGVHTTHGIEYLKENSCQFVARLSPVLYTSPWIAAIFTIASIAGFIMQYMRLSPLCTHNDLSTHCNNQQHAASHQTSTGSKDLEHAAPSLPKPNQILMHDLQNPQSTKSCSEEEEELFRLARIQAGKRQPQVLSPAMLETIREIP